ncbi:zinc finger protein 511 [Pelodytes ibericus]
MVTPELFSPLLDPTAMLNLAELPVLPVDKKQSLDNTFTPVTVRFTRDHEFFEDGDVHRHLYLQGVLRSTREVEERTKMSEFRCQAEGCSQLFNTLQSYEHHYNTRHRNVCATCTRSFPSARLLDIHILEWHDSLFQIMAEKENMYQCLVEGCMEKFKTRQERKDHLITTHLYPADFRFDKPKKPNSKKKQDKNPAKEMPMDTGLSEELPVESMEVGPSSAGDGSPEKSNFANTAPCKQHNKNRVPRTICFGHGAVRGFTHSKKNKK